LIRGSLDYFLYLRKNQWDKREVIEKNEWSKIIENINYSYIHVPYYKEQFKKAGITPKDIKTKQDILKIPLTTKQDIIQSNLRYVSDKFKDTKLYTSRTSGSTGEPFVSYFDKRSWAILKFASKFRARRACGFSLTEKFVIVEAMPIEESKSYNSSFRWSKIIIRKKFLSVYDSIDEHVVFYQKFKPTSIYGFPSYFINLVSYLEKNSIKLNSVKRIFTSSEILDTSTRKIIENYFDCKINDVYGSTETKEVAWECPQHEGYHINEDLVYVECIGDDGKPVKNGNEGRIVMTSLENKAMPLLRYCIGDMGVILNEKCSCGRSFILMKPVYGRIIDYFILNDGRKISPYKLTMSIEKIQGIMQYQIIQKTKSLVEISLKINKKFHPDSKNKIIYNLQKILCEDVNIVLTIVNDFQDNNKKSKFRVVKSEIIK
jgi:phenylacetate-CoA ligase